MIEDEHDVRVRSSILPVFLVLAVSTIPVAGVFTWTRLFVVRDLALTFHSRFLFVRHTILSGSFPLWDPYTANGQSAVADALYQLFHLPSLAVRLLLPETIAYNMWVALPVPLSGLGMYVFLRRELSATAAAFGAIAFALAGPIASSTNFPNLSWSIATAPYVLWGVDRVFARRTVRSAALLALIVSTQALAGEPVSFATTMAVAAAYALFVDRRWRDIPAVALTAAGCGVGALLSAVQFVPLAAASRTSLRSTMTIADFWAFHPLALLELFVPHFFGDYFNSNLRELAWMVALNSDRDPFYYTMYIGVAVALLALVAALSGRPRTLFWTIVIAVCAIASLGPHTPIYPALQMLVPPLRAFRFPVKYLSMAALGLAALSAMTLQWLLDGAVPRRALRAALIAGWIAVVLTYVAIAFVLLAPSLPIRGLFHLAVWAKVPAPIQGAEFLLYRARPLLTSLLLKSIAFVFLLGIAASARRERRFALVVLVAAGLIDLIAANSSVNPTLPPALVSEPSWIGHVPRDMHERLYVGGRLEGFVNVFDVDAPKYAAYTEGYTQMEQRYMLVAELLFHPSGARIREAMSYDLPLLWPLEYARTVGLFKYASREERLRFLERVGTRFVILPTPPFPGARPIARLKGAEQLQLYDFNPQARRVYVVPDALLGPDVDWQILGLFQPRFNPASGVLVSERPPPASGVPGPPVAAHAAFLEDGLNRVVVRAGLPADGYLSLLDTFSPDWRVDVDGGMAPLLRANGLFRAVHLTAGQHTVTFTYHPSKLYEGAAISAVSALALMLACLWEARRDRRATAP